MYKIVPGQDPRLGAESYSTDVIVDTDCKDSEGHLLALLQVIDRTTAQEFVDAMNDRALEHIVGELR